MKQMMYVGVRCEGGRHNLILGKTEIEPSSAPALLHEQLRREGWNESTSERCLECGTPAFVPLDGTILLGPVVVIDGVEL